MPHDFPSRRSSYLIPLLCILALTIFSLLRRFRPAVESVTAPVQQREQAASDDASPHRAAGDTVADYMLAPKVIMEWLFSAIIVFSLYLLLRGHDSPGGGFAAGIAMSIAILIQYMARGTRQMELLLSIRPFRSEERRVGKECVSTFRSRVSPSH